MSEYTPITGELRAAMRQWGWFESDGSITFVSSPMPPSIDAEKALAISGSEFDRLCDAIDSIHAQLERENAALKAELDRVLGEQDNGATMSLPLDMNGEPIHIGDVMETERFGVVEVEGFIHNAIAFNVYDPQPARICTVPANQCLHRAPDTWEQIIDDAELLAREWFNTDMSENEHAEGLDALVARCKALCECTKEDA